MDSDRLPLYELHRKEGLPPFVDAAPVQPRDIVMVEMRQDLTFAFEPMDRAR